jgi:hypothetical protein
MMPREQSEHSAAGVDALPAASHEKKSSSQYRPDDLSKWNAVNYRLGRPQRKTELTCLCGKKDRMCKGSGQRGELLE